MAHIFLSHSSEDYQFTHALKERLESLLPGVTVFASTEPDAIPSGEWEKALYENLENADILVVVMTPMAEKSIWVAFEYGYFQRKKNGENIHLLRHPRASLYSPFSRLQYKLMTDKEQLKTFFDKIVYELNYKKLKRFDTAALADIASHLPILSSEERKLQNDLILQMRTPDNSRALDAIFRLRHHGWLIDGTLAGQNFEGARLQKANLAKANLENAKLNWADLHEVDFTEAHLSGVDFGGSHFEKLSSDSKRAATFWYADLQKATFGGGAVLRGVNFGGANLKGANFLSASLTSAEGLETAVCDETTMLPDGAYWKPNTDWYKYTTIIIGEF